MIKIYRWGAVSEADIFIRGEIPSGVEDDVRAIIEDVRQNGDEAVRRYGRRFDKSAPDCLEASREEIDAACAQADPALRAVLDAAAANIEKFHRRQVRSGFVYTGEDGVVVGQKVTPLDKVGVYIPGGTASYPSSVLMNVIPARLAGVGEIILTTPPGPQGRLNPAVAAAAVAAGAHRIFKAGGAQAVAALAYGTKSFPRVDKIVGPGNAYVAEAKKQVFGVVGIDMTAGPSEILVIADGSASARLVAADMLSQAEHDAMASAVLVTDSMALAQNVAKELEKQLSDLPRADIARASIDNNGKIIVADSLDQALDISNALAPEHLELCVDNPFDYLDKVRHAGSIFLGRYCPEALGDYYAGPNHTLPTLGTARFFSPLSVDDFVKKSSFTYYTQAALARVRDDVVRFAKAEGLDAHARSVALRFSGQPENSGTQPGGDGP